jgi:hypothetical protein
MSNNVEGIEIPKGLTREGRKAAHTIVKLLKERGMTNTGGCRTFYTPQEWRDRGERYGRDALLVVVYDGGEVGPFFDLGACYRTGAASDYEPYEAMRQRLTSVGVWSECATHWYSAVYAL